MQVKEQPTYEKKLPNFFYESKSECFASEE